MTGWRLGYACAPKVIMDQMVKIHQFAIMCAPTTSQYAAVEALRNGDDDVAKNEGVIQSEKKLSCHELRDMDLIVLNHMEHSMYSQALRRFGLTSEEFATRLLEEERLP